MHFTSLYLVLSSFTALQPFQVDAVPTENCNLSGCFSFPPLWFSPSFRLRTVHAQAHIHMLHLLSNISGTRRGQYIVCDCECLCVCVCIRTYTNRALMYARCVHGARWSFERAHSLSAGEHQQKFYSCSIDCLRVALLIYILDENGFSWHISNGWQWQAICSATHCTHTHSHALTRFVCEAMNASSKHPSIYTSRAHSVR